VYKGSVVVDFNVELPPAPAQEETSNDDDNSDNDGSSDDSSNQEAIFESVKQLEDLKVNLKSMISDQSEAFGAPVLSASTAEETVIEDPTWIPPQPTIQRLTEKPPPVTDPSENSEESTGLAKGSIIVITCVVVIGLITVVAAIVGLSFHLYKKNAKGKQGNRNFRPDKPGVRADDAAKGDTERKMNSENKNELFPADGQRMHKTGKEVDDLRRSIDNIPSERQ
jgi:hypothetical protein